MKAFLHSKATLWPDWLLTALASLGLIQAIYAGFLLEDVLYRSPLLCLVALAAWQALLLLLAQRRQTILAGIAGCALAFAAAVYYVQTVQPAWEESGNTLFLSCLILLAVGLLLFLLSRSRAGLLALLALGSLMQAGSHFLQFPAPGWAYVLFLAATAILLLFRFYLAALATCAAGQAQPLRYAGQSALLCLIALGLCTGIYYRLIRPLNPPPQALYLRTRLQSMELLEVLGVSSVRTVFEETLQSQQPPEEEEQGNTPAQEPEEEDAGMDAPATAPEEAEAPENGNQNQEQAALAVSYDSPTSPPWWLLLFPLALLVAILWRKGSRRRWQRRIQALPAQQAVVQYYTFFRKRLRLLGLRLAPGQTLGQFAALHEAQLQAFSVPDMDFGAMTAVYEAVLYGQQEPPLRSLPASLPSMLHFTPTCATGWAQPAICSTGSFYSVIKANLQTFLQTSPASALINR